MSKISEMLQGIFTNDDGTDDVFYEDDEYKEFVDMQTRDYYQENNILMPGDSLEPAGTMYEHYDPSDDY